MTDNLEELERLRFDLQVAKDTFTRVKAEGHREGHFNVAHAKLLGKAEDATRSLIATAREVEGLRAEVDRLRICVGLHVNADAYASTFPEDAEDAAQLRKSETWHRLSARSVLWEQDEDACNRAAKAWLLEQPETQAAFAAARAALEGKGG